MKVFNHGKYKGETHEHVADVDPEYIIEAVKTDPTIDKELYKACVDVLDERDDDNTYRELEL